jgi:hypothetical protein
LPPVVSPKRGGSKGRRIIGTIYTGIPVFSGTAERIPCQGIFLFLFVIGEKLFLTLMKSYNTDNCAVLSWLKYYFIAIVLSLFTPIRNVLSEETAVIIG